jgi:hypothetical protein
MLQALLLGIMTCIDEIITMHQAYLFLFTIKRASPAKAYSKWLFIPYRTGDFILYVKKTRQK